MTVLKTILLIIFILFALAAMAILIILASALLYDTVMDVKRKEEEQKRR